MMRRRAWVLCIALAACRDMPEIFVAPDPFDSISPGDQGRLTWNANEDHSPLWNATSDSVYYSARSFPNFPETGGLLLKLGARPGIAKLLLEALQHQVTPQPWLGAAALARNGQSLAFFQLTEVYDAAALCTGGTDCRLPPRSPEDTSYSQTPLVSGRLRVRNLQTGAESQLHINFQGKAGNSRMAYPFQRQFERDGVEGFRPSWSPDGTRVVFSSGLQLFIWTVGADAATPIPNTTDGVWPAWSPNGETIAYTRLRRGAARVFTCDCYSQGRGNPIEEHRRTIYDDGRTRIGDLITIRTDGTQQRVLGEGEAPAWTPDGNTLVFQRNYELWRSAPDGSNAALVPNTRFGFEPAISPNGQRLTFSRYMGARIEPLDANPEPKKYDIWVVNF